MDRRNLYKISNSHLLNLNAKAKRVSRVHVERSTKRKDLFLTGRNIKDSFVKEIKEPYKENIQKSTLEQKQENYLAKYLAWKSEKEKKREEEKKNKPKPFVSTVKNSLAIPAYKFEMPKKFKYGHVTKPQSHDRNKKTESVSKNPGQIEKFLRKPFAPVNRVNPPVIKVKSPTLVLHGAKKPLIKSQLKPEKVHAPAYTPGKVGINNHEEGFITFTSFITSTGLRISLNPNALAEKLFTEEISPILVNEAGEITQENCELKPLEKEKGKSKNARKGLILSQNNDVERDSSVEKNLQVVQCNDIQTVKNLNISSNNKSDEQLCSVKYFRKMLNDEINRLHNLCCVWEQYKLENAQQVEEVGGDMINAAIGQTKLLTSTRLEQFRELIDRCEQGIGKRSTGESTRKMLSEDLEGFWSMVQLQVETRRPPLLWPYGFHSNRHRRHRSIECEKCGAYANSSTSVSN